MLRSEWQEILTGGGGDYGKSIPGREKKGIWHMSEEWSQRKRVRLEHCGSQIL